MNENKSITTSSLVVFRSFTPKEGPFVIPNEKGYKTTKKDRETYEESFALPRPRFPTPLNGACRFLSSG